MRVLITGADGFVGAHVTRALLKSGMEVGVLTRSGATFRRLQDVADRIHILQGDLNEIDRLRPTLNNFKPEACIHLAWYAEPGKYLHAPQNIAMLNSSLALIQALAEVGCTHFVGAGTCAEYDAEQGWLKEEGRTRPETLYAASKLSLCLAGEQLARQNRMGFAWGRIFYPYGPEEDSRRMVPALIRALLAEEPFPASRGDQVRDYIYVEDVAQAFRLLLTQKTSGIFNIGSGVPITVRHLMETIEEIVGKPGLIQFGAIPYRDWDPRFLCANIQNLRNLGWVPCYTLHEGMHLTTQWWRKQDIG